MSYIVPKSVVVQTGTVDANTLCGLPCSYYLDFDNLTNVPANLGIPDYSTASEGDLLTVNSSGDVVWSALSLQIDGGAAATVYSSANTTINAGGA